MKALQAKKKMVAGKLYKQAGSKDGKGAPHFKSYAGKSGKGSLNKAGGNNFGERMYLGKDEQQRP
jgi:hypothetical protein